MANKYSKVKYEQFIERLDFFILFVFSGLLVLAMAMACLIGHEILKNTNIDGSIRIDSSLCTVFFISCFFFFLALYRITIVFKEAVFFINEVQINHNAITLTGYYYNTKWQETLDIKNTQVDIVTQKRGKAPEVYYLQFIDELNLKYNINTSFYWSYSEILILYSDIKNLQKEKNSNRQKKTEELIFFINVKHKCTIIKNIVRYLKGLVNHNTIKALEKSGAFFVCKILKI